MPDVSVYKKDKNLVLPASTELAAGMWNKWCLQRDSWSLFFLPFMNTKNKAPLVYQY